MVFVANFNIHDSCTYTAQFVNPLYQGLKFRVGATEYQAVCDVSPHVYESDPPLPPPQLHPPVQIWPLLAPKNHDSDGKNAELKVSKQESRN